MQESQLQLKIEAATSTGYGRVDGTINKSGTTDKSC